MVESPVLETAPQQSSKRKASSGNAADKPHRPVKRRASKACQCCRARKVRCNVVEHGAPCTNCRLDEVDCIVTESKRRRKTITKLPEDLESDKHRPNNILDGLLSLQTLSRNEGSSRSCSEDHVSHSLYRTHSHHLVSGDVRLRHPYYVSSGTSALRPGGSRNSPLTSAKHFSGVASDSTDGVGSMYPEFLRPLSNTLALEDIAYLERAGAFTLPPVGFRNELIRCYIEFVHPFLPILELQYTLDTIARGDGTLGQISLLVLQAVMFAGSSFVKMTSLRRAGYTTRSEARSKFMKNAKLLYHFDTETERLSQIQALLLMTYSEEASGEGKDAWYWLGNAVNIALSMGLDRPSLYTNSTVERRSLYKRVWWSCMSLDRLLAFTLQRPTHLNMNDADVPTITIEDLELDVSPLDRSFNVFDCSPVKLAQSQRDLALIFVQRCGLIECIDRVLFKANGAKDALESWRSNLPDNLLETRSGPVDRVDLSTTLQAALLQLLFASVSTSLESQQATQLPSPKEEASPKRLEETYQRLLDEEFLRYLPSPCAHLLQKGLVGNQSHCNSGSELWRSCNEALLHIEAALTDSFPSTTDSNSGDGRSTTSGSDQSATPTSLIEKNPNPLSASSNLTLTINPTIEALKQRSSLQEATTPDSDHDGSVLGHSHHSFDDDSEQQQLDDDASDCEFDSFINLDDSVVETPNLNNTAAGSFTESPLQKDACTWNVDRMNMAPDGCVIKSEQPDMGIGSIPTVAA